MHGIKSKGIPATVIWPKVPGFMAASIKLWIGMAMDVKQDIATIALGAVHKLRHHISEGSGPYT